MLRISAWWFQTQSTSITAVVQCDEQAQGRLCTQWAVEQGWRSMQTRLGSTGKSLGRSIFWFGNMHADKQANSVLRLCWSAHTTEDHACGYCAPRDFPPPIGSRVAFRKAGADWDPAPVRRRPLRLLVKKGSYWSVSQCASVIKRVSFISNASSYTSPSNLSSCLANMEEHSVVPHRPHFAQRHTLRSSSSSFFAASFPVSGRARCATPLIAQRIGQVSFDDAPPDVRYHRVNCLDRADPSLEYLHNVCGPACQYITGVLPRLAKRGAIDVHFLCCGATKASLPMSSWCGVWCACTFVRSNKMHLSSKPWAVAGAHALDESAPFPEYVVN